MQLNEKLHVRPDMTLTVDWVLKTNYLSHQDKRQEVSPETKQ